MMIGRKLGRLGITIVAAFCAAVGIAAHSVHAEGGFFAGKTLTIVNNYNAGGASDLEGRLYARFLPKYLKGHPNIVFKNLPGAGGLLAFNWLGKVARPDGLTASFFTWDPVVQIVGDQRLQVPFNKFTFVAGSNSTVVAFIRKDVAPGINKPADFLNAKDFKVAGLSDTNEYDLRHRLSIDLLLGRVYRMVTGFNGFAPMFKAIQQNEVQFASSSLPGYRGRVVPTMVKTGVVVPVFQFGTIAKDGSYNRNPDVPDLPTWMDLYHLKYGNGAKPNGIKWDALQIINQIETNLLRTILMPPGSPKEAANELAEAFAAVAKDHEFVADYRKVIKADPHLVIGEAPEKIIGSLGSVDPKLVAFFKDYIATAHQ